MTGDVTSPSSDRVTPEPPPGLGERGIRLWADWSGHGFGPGHLVLLEEACRTADTLERLNGMLADESSTWIELVPNEAESDESTTELRVVVNGLLVEQRQQQANFRQLVAELRYGLSNRAAGAALPPAASGESAAPEPVSAPAAGESAAPEPVSAPAAGEGGLGDLIDATRRFSTPGGGSS